jgi:hypothetical protein
MLHSDSAFREHSVQAVFRPEKAGLIVEYGFKRGKRKKNEKFLFFFVYCIDDMRILVRIQKDGGQVENVFSVLGRSFLCRKHSFPSVPKGTFYGGKESSLTS